ncbi:MAG TPA: hypothetical protein VGH11_13455 [Jatrophihabitans sp.]|jgi:hypothetical protein
MTDTTNNTARLCACCYLGNPMLCADCVTEGDCTGHNPPQTNVIDGSLYWGPQNATLRGAGLISSNPPVIIPPTIQWGRCKECGIATDKCENYGRYLFCPPCAAAYTQLLEYLALSSS